MSLRVHSHHGDVAGRFNEDAPRPPVPGEEDSDVVPCFSRPYTAKGDAVRGEGAAATPRRSDLDLGYEPEGSASPPPAHLRWAESLHSLLDDEDGTALFRSFLQQEASADLLDFWFACSGFRKLPAAAGSDGRRLKLAKAIYRKYIADGGGAGGGIVAKKIKPATKAFIRGCVSRAQLDLALFEQAQVEVQAMMEDHAYPLFLKSDVYLNYAHTGVENSPRPAMQLPPSPGNRETPLPGYLPTLMEDKEWADPMKDHTHSSGLTQRLLMETASLRSSANWKGARSGIKELANPYYVNSGFSRAPLTSTNDSELHSLSSDADTISLTDSSVDGVPQSQIHKQLRRHMQESVRANGHVPLPHIPRTHRMPKDIHVEPQKFAAELISRLELVQRERENLRRLEEQLHRVRMEEECDVADVSMATSLSSSTKTGQVHVRHRDTLHAVSQWRDAHDDNPESILDDHVQRVMKTPGCQSPRNPAHTYTQKHLHHTHMETETRTTYACNGDFHYYGNRGHCYSDGLSMMDGTIQSEELPYSSQLNSLSRRNGHGKSDDGCDIDGRGLDGRGLDLPEEADQKQKILQWMLEGERESTRHRKSASGIRPGWASGSDQYDPSSAPSQSEETRWRMEEEKRRSTPHHSKQRLKSSNRRRAVCDIITVAYYFCGEPIPYRTSVKGRVVTLGQFKELLTKKEAYRFYFKKVSDEFDCGVVYEEVHEDDAVLPIFEERIIGKVERID
ncbi:axin-1-like [Electrophorus electricus]|uniref:axin-1-like n=1 Tax=Electrophorus electricus TaxID=8005 RepID=UPI0015D04EB7|nr:axin-1-like [Electrophorus electricus]XP_026887708.2 axin-1-like [Electrophorus electricus]XP_035390895.1 axin-1-like [Electrophorus electricus]XP_035390896.1 axin-1-like [Electrophorus electricus]